MRLQSCTDMQLGTTPLVEGIAEQRGDMTSRVNADSVEEGFDGTSSNAEVVTVGKQSEMLNILVNDSFSNSNNSKLPPTKKGKKRKGKKVAKEMGFSAKEILKMKKDINKEDEGAAKQRATPVLYFKDFEKRFDDMLKDN